MKNILRCVILVAGTAVVTSCQSVYNAGRAPAVDLAKEGSVVFVRPDRYSIIGTRSVRDYVEITYEKTERNEAGLLKAQVGLRNRGGKHWYDVRGPNFSLSIKTAFYDEPLTERGPAGPPVYETNWQRVTLVRGDTGHFEAVCPVASARYYQLTVSELLAR